MEKKLTAEDIKKMTERMKNSKNPIIRRILAMVEKKMYDALIDLKAISGTKLNPTKP